MVRLVFFSVFFLFPSWVFAQHANHSDQSLADSGVLVSPPIGNQSSEDLDTTGSDDAAAESTSNTNSPAHHKHHQTDSGTSSSNSSSNSSSSDDIVNKATQAVVFQMNANLHLTSDQLSAVQPIIEKSIVATRSLQQSVEDGTIDSSTMVNQRAQLTNDENQQLSGILSADQMRTWINIQNQSDDDNHHR